MVLRPLVLADHEAVLALNERHVELLAPMDAERLEVLLGLADRAVVVDVGGEVAGFALTFAPGTAYDSTHYRWFADRYGPRFYYLDRVVLDGRFRRRGLASRVYDAAEARARSYGRLAVEVVSEPPNEPSLAFHAGRGFAEVARSGGGGKQVTMLVKELG